MEDKQTVCEEENFLDLIKGQNLFKANGSVHKAARHVLYCLRFGLGYRGGLVSELY